MSVYGDSKSHTAAGHFSRLFPDLPAASFSTEALTALATAMMATASGEGPIPSGYTYFGQFVDHDMTFDAEGNDLPDTGAGPELPLQLATPMLDLDNVYGKQDEFINQSGKFHIGCTKQTTEPSRPDLDRTFAGQGRIADARNEDNLPLMHTHLLFQLLHNKLIGPDPDIPLSRFSEVKKEVLQIYQTIIVQDYLRRILDPKVCTEVFEQGLVHFYKSGDQLPPIPVEFSGAAYRFGHSMVRESYDWNRFLTHANGNPATLQDLLQRTGLYKLTDVNRQTNSWYIDWRFFLPLDPACKPNHAMLIDCYISDFLKNLPHSGGGSLPLRNLLRGVRYGLPSGQAVASAMAAVTDIEPVTEAEFLQAASPALKAVMEQYDLHKCSPLWFYILFESGIRAGKGAHLGPMGSRIVAEVFHAMLLASPHSVLKEPYDVAAGSLREVVGGQPLELRHVVTFTGN
ncbi:MAG: hypothetical protein KDI36_04305 [Pseudomonadales bacterium]|nr:hypothetical protein [Pseudomonadales bacterium]